MQSQSISSAAYFFFALELPLDTGLKATTTIIAKTTLTGPLVDLGTIRT